MLSFDSEMDGKLCCIVLCNIRGIESIFGSVFSEHNACERQMRAWFKSVQHLRCAKS